MTTRIFALAYGIVFAIAGIAGFVGALVMPPGADDPPLTVDAAHGRLLGLFPVNLLHNAVHIVFGIWGVLAFRTLDAARIYARSVAVIYAVLAVMGLIPALNTTFGLIPIHGHDVWLHAVLAAVAGYFGFLRTDVHVAARPYAARR